MKLHIVPKPQGWAVREENGKWVSRTFKQKIQAVRYAKTTGFATVVHKKDGRFQRLFKGRAKNNNQHVIPHGRNWAVKCENCLKSTKVFEDRTDAVLRAEDIARNYDSLVYIHRSDGTIEDAKTPTFFDPVKRSGWSLFN